MSVLYGKQKINSVDEVREEYKEKLNERLRGARTKVGEGMSVNDVYDIFKGTVLEVADEVVGWRERGEKKRKRMVDR